jgi:hypothetical protein
MGRKSVFCQPVADEITKKAAGTASRVSSQISALGHPEANVLAGCMMETFHKIFTMLSTMFCTGVSVNARVW